ncbi:putative RING-H2 finger protein ATL12 [Abrus precatorius]|uniref:RING-type E3 ubiquitin transferase n=1 Tax=Abrus precatorius TaxID=3816 RepID=A0A8B8LNB5_ABRPR|nr:putative RING-H2 finger protein ATL12 [Abrus precatorius]
MSNIFNPFKNRLLMLMMLLSLPFNAEAQDREDQNLPQLPQTVHPSKGIVIAVLSTMFAITLLLLFYVKFCRVSPHRLLNPNQGLQNFHSLTRSRSRVSGIDKQVIQTLPFFNFSSLKGSKQGLECTVCLSKFEETEILRLLPKCKHAFHMDCIDKWLESHSTCPLCRQRVEAGDIKNLNFSLSTSFLRVPSNLTEDPSLEIFVQREPSHRGFNNGSGFWEKRVINHRIVISDVVARSRWSDLNSSDMLSLNCEMLNDMCSARFSPLESTNSEDFQGTLSLLSSSNEREKRSMSEIAKVPRFAEIRESESEERLWKIWLPIARRTVQRFARQEGNSIELEHKPLPSNVRSL